MGAHLHRAFPEARLGLPLKRLGAGYASQVFETRDGTVFKLARNPIAQASYAKERRVLLFLADKILGCPIPRPEYYLASSAEFPFGVIGYRKIRGELLSTRPVAAGPSMMSGLAAFLIQLHGIELTAADVSHLDLEAFPPSLAVVRETWRNVAAWLQANLAEAEFLALQAQWRQLEHFWEQHTEAPRLTHGDLWPENIVVDQHGHLAGILDFGSVRLGDPAIDFAVQRYISPTFRQSVIDNYRRRGGAPGLNLEERMTYLLALREVYGLEYGLMIGQVDPDALPKIRRTFGLQA